MSDVQSRGDSKLTLRPLLSEDRFEAIAAHGELLLEDFHFLLDFDPENDWDQYLQNLDEQSLGTNLMQGQVSATFLVAVIGSRISARVSIRHCLNEYLNGTGGVHIGYAVRPEFRRQ